jgi:hypothetical protein
VVKKPGKIVPTGLRKERFFASLRMTVGKAQEHGILRFAQIDSREDARKEDSSLRSE